MRRSLADVWSRSGIVNVADIDFEGVAVEACDEDVGLRVEADGFRMAGELVDMLVLPAGGVEVFGVARTDNEKTGQTAMVRAERIRSSTQLLFFCVTETILCRG